MDVGNIHEATPLSQPNPTSGRKPRAPCPSFEGQGARLEQNRQVLSGVRVRQKPPN